MLLDLEEGLLRKLSPPQKKVLKGMAGFQRPGREEEVEKSERRAVPGGISLTSRLGPDLKSQP